MRNPLLYDPLHTDLQTGDGCCSYSIATANSIAIVNDVLAHASQIAEIVLGS